MLGQCIQSGGNDLGIIYHEKVKRHLENLGLAVGQKVTVLSSEGGALILKVKDGRMALDRKMSAGIFI